MAWCLDVELRLDARVKGSLTRRYQPGSKTSEKRGGRFDEKVLGKARRLPGLVPANMDCPPDARPRAAAAHGYRLGGRPGGLICQYCSQPLRCNCLGAPGHIGAADGLRPGCEVVENVRSNACTRASICAIGQPSPSPPRLAPSLLVILRTIIVLVNTARPLCDSPRCGAVCDLRAFPFRMHQPALGVRLRRALRRVANKIGAPIDGGG
jgi:hypothetical protein